MNKRRKFFIATALAFATALVCAQSGHSDKKKWTWSAEASLGFIYGRMGEYAYYDKGSSDKLSYLEWDMKPLWFYGVDLEAASEKFSFLVNLKGFVPASCGYMQDSDWLQDYQWGTGNRSVKTNYSEHDNFLTSGFSSFGEISYKFCPSEKIFVFPLFAIEYQDMYFSGRDGTAWYGKDNFYPYNAGGGYSTIQDFFGKVIDYERRDVYVWLGCRASWVFSDKWNFSVSGYVAPYVYMWSRDSHFLRSIYFVDIGYDRFCAGKLKIAANYSLKKKVSLKLEAGCLMTEEIHTSKAFQSSEKDNGYYEVDAEDGFSSEYFEYSVAVKFLF
ncbi:omptin family outer membrane protease [Treponema parvum]|uniref:omptin family outer membrane protease n=1 Tax=Treponema parvum TaxID=138851 RepID=UPI001AEC6586|nr:omptin family outer membrane protease [Treponema parvum]QTQ15255.1 omptin family outer membrane protease [Treponema parvum]